MSTYNRNNFAETTLGAAIANNSDTAITVTSGASFPTVPFLVTIGTEILKCTNKGAGTNWTVTRGEQSSVAAAHDNGTAVQNNITAGDFSPLVEGPASAVDTHLAVFDLTTGKLIKDGGACTAAGLALLDDANATAQIATLGLDADIATLSLPASTTITAAGAALLDDASATVQIATLGLDADIATLSLPANTTITAAGAALIDDASAAAQLVTLGALPLAGGTLTGDLILVKAAGGGDALLQVQPTDQTGQATLRLKSAGAIGGTGGHADIQFHDAGTLAFRFIGAFGNTVGNRYGGFLAYVDRDGNKLPIWFFTTDAAGNLQLALKIAAGQTAGTAGGITVSGAFGCNAKTPQTAYSGGAALDAYATGAFGLDTAAHVSALYAMVVAMRAALVANGIMS